MDNYFKEIFYVTQKKIDEQNRIKRYYDTYDPPKCLQDEKVEKYRQVIYEGPKLVTYKPELNKTHWGKDMTPQRITLQSEFKDLLVHPNEKYITTKPLKIGTRLENIVGEIILPHQTLWALATIDKMFLTDIRFGKWKKEKAGYLLRFLVDHSKHFKQNGIDLIDGDENILSKNTPPVPTIIQLNDNNKKYLETKEEMENKIKKYNNLYDRKVNELLKYLDLLNHDSLELIRSKLKKLEIFGNGFHTSLEIFNEKLEKGVSKLNRFIDSESPLNKRLKKLQTNFKKVRKFIVNKQINIADKYISEKCDKHLETIETKLSIMDYFTIVNTEMHKKKLNKLTSQLENVQEMLDNKLNCKICFERTRDTVLIPCGHVFCNLCSIYLKEGLEKCAICKNGIDKLQKCFI